MSEMDARHCQIVQESLAHKRMLDERTFASLAVLTDRLERLKKLGKPFSEVGFSPAVEQLRKRQKPVAVG